MCVIINYEVRKMADKRKISTILGICGATVLAAGGSIFLTNTGLSLLDQSQQAEGETEPGLGAQTGETETPITVEQFSKTADSFVVSSKTASAAGKDDEEEETTETEDNNAASEGGTSAAGSNGTAGQDDSTMYATGGVNVRSSAGVEGDILGTLQTGEGVTVTGNREGNWVEVSYNGQTGYVSQNYLQTGSGSSASGSTSGGSSDGSGGSSSNGSSSNGGSSNSGSSNSGSSNGNSSGSSNTPAVITWNVTAMSGTMYATGDVNVRSGAGTNNSRIGGLSAGSSVTVTGSTDNGWIQVSYDGQTGYVAGNYLSWNKPSSGGSSSGGSSNGSGGSSSGAWDDSYTYDLSSRYVSADEFDGWSASDLAIVRNEIFARHGRIFTTQKYKDYFSQKTWYEPTYDPSYFDANLDSFLNDYEWANLAVVQKLEDARS